MREIRLSGSEGGEAGKTGFSYPIQPTTPHRSAAVKARPLVVAAFTAAF